MVATTPVIASPVVDAAAPLATVDEDAGPPPEPAVYGPNTGLVALRKKQVCPGDSSLPGGYSKDGRFFYTWTNDGGEGPTSPWQVIDTRTNQVTVHVFKPSTTDFSSPKYDAEANRFSQQDTEWVAKNEVGICDLAWSGPKWPHPDLEFWSRATADSESDPFKASLEFGVRTRSSGKSVVLHNFDFGGKFLFESDSLAIHCAQLSPDGKELGVIAFGCGAHFRLEQKPFRIPVDAVAAAVR